MRAYQDQTPSRHWEYRSDEVKVSIIMVLLLMEDMRKVVITVQWFGRGRGGVKNDGKVTEKSPSAAQRDLGNAPEDSSSSAAPGGQRQQRNLPRQREGTAFRSGEMCAGTWPV